MVSQTNLSSNVSQPAGCPVRDGPRQSSGKFDATDGCVASRNDPADTLANACEVTGRHCSGDEHFEAEIIILCVR
jgi:hypothetical protein